MEELLNSDNKRLPLSSDIVFKRVFSSDDNNDLLKSLLESILNIKMQEVEVLDSELTRETTESKAGTLDIKARVDKDTVINIEMQVQNEYNIEKRSAYYMASIASLDLKTKEDYKELSKIIVINILCFDYFKRNSFYNIAHMKFEKATDEAYIDLGYKKEDELVTDRLEMHFIELKKFMKKNLEASKSNMLNSWLWLICGKEDKVEKVRKESKEIQKAIDVIDRMSMDSKEWDLYESRQKALINYNSGLTAAKEKGKEERNKRTE